MSTLQKIAFSMAGIGLFILLLLTLYGNKGYTDLVAVRKEKQQIVEKNVTIEKGNIALYRTIKRLKHDPKYIEAIARQELGMVSKDEMILKFKEQ